MNCPRIILIGRETVNLAKRLDKQKIQLGTQFMKVMVTMGKTGPAINYKKVMKTINKSHKGKTTSVKILDTTNYDVVKIKHGE